MRHPPHLYTHITDALWGQALISLHPLSLYTDITDALWGQALISLHPLSLCSSLYRLSSSLIMFLAVSRTVDPSMWPGKQKMFLPLIWSLHPQVRSHGQNPPRHRNQLRLSVNRVAGLCRKRDAVKLCNPRGNVRYRLRPTSPLCLALGPSRQRDLDLYQKFAFQPTIRTGRGRLPRLNSKGPSGKCGQDTAEYSKCIIVVT